MAWASSAAVAASFAGGEAEEDRGVDAEGGRVEDAGLVAGGLLDRGAAELEADGFGVLDGAFDGSDAEAAELDGALVATSPVRPRSGSNAKVSTRPTTTAAARPIQAILR
jgi:hypothetical protein